ncbi:thiosulfate sulfurtransferase [Leptospira wolffii]|uniref:sulfurtransferase n=1 Tax=Leptospira wolffii TaxID=409998 RepID=UPI001083C522|nr:rhodanese-like domain-containing protein [Leptospira wolffii]TGK62725.1 thiosulfate sulfurtransferase [Leptospira wolffii]TGK73888.1 thiosulfate sulfurtransferase [Leptospira wolffii]TGK75043.1 thiosulfate sulfurtransferase [Leptospira wolffii]TGL28750.1 thiosulfate sulfurtransferase [Leptospira wolffii]
MIRFAFFFTLLLLSHSLLASETRISGLKGWFVDASTSLYLSKQGAILIDAREGITLRSLPKSISLGWQEISRKDSPFIGNLLPDSEAKAVLAKKGILPNTILLVYGDPTGGWGEEGRIVWSLRTLGFSKSFIIDGGYAALKKASNSSVPDRSDILAEIRNSSSEQKKWDVDRNFVSAKLGDKNTVFIDTREEREYLGETPYGESKGGHLPKAKWIYYRNFLDKEGFLLPDSKILAKLHELGISKDKTVVSYCTGGVRSGWMTSVLASLGYDAKNYAGSMWEWTSPKFDNPLVLK